MKSGGNSRRELSETLKSILRDNQPIVEERLAILQNVLSSAEAGTLQRAEKEDAKSAAHKLAGSLGMFGLLEASSLASEIEQRLERSVEGERIKLRELVNALDRQVKQEFRK